MSIARVARRMSLPSYPAKGTRVPDSVWKSDHEASSRSYTHPTTVPCSAQTVYSGGFRVDHRPIRPALLRPTIRVQQREILPSFPHF